MLAKPGTSCRTGWLIHGWKLWDHSRTDSGSQPSQTPSDDTALGCMRVVCFTRYFVIIIGAVNMARCHIPSFGKASCSEPWPRLPYCDHGSGGHFIRFYLPRRRPSGEDFWGVLSKSRATSGVIGPFESISGACGRAANEIKALRLKWAMHKSSSSLPANQLPPSNPLFSHTD